MHKDLIYIKGYSAGKKLTNTLRAINISEKYHSGQKRKSGEDYIIHPAKVASVLLALGIDKDVVLASCLLHDVLEDTILTRNLLIDCLIDEEVVDIVELLTKKDGESTELYYKNILNNPYSTLVKIADRCHNVSTMQYFTLEKIEKYIKETNEYVIPMCKEATKKYPQFADIFYVLKFQIESIVNLSEALINDLVQPSIQESSI